MTSRKLHEAQQPDYQRWEPTSLSVPVSESVKLTTAEAVEQIHQQAHQEGYDAGFAEGHAAGYRQGQQLAGSEIAQIQALIGSVQAASQQFSNVLAEDLLNLALGLTQQMLRQALKTRPELLLAVVRSAMESLPQHSQHPHIHMHPQDAALLRSHMQHEITSGGWKIIEDQRITPGGCRIETVAAEVDATLQTRWRQLAQALGQDVDWLHD